LVRSPASVVPVFQAKSKFFQARPNSVEVEQRESKKTLLISLDSLVRIEHFQLVALTPGPFFSFCRCRRIKIVATTHDPCVGLRMQMSLGVVMAKP